MKHILFILLFITTCYAQSIPNRRPAPSDRKFNSTAINNAITDITSKMKDADLAQLFTNCWPNTLDTTVQYFNAQGPDSFIITGDISAQWLRDSTNQVLPYISFATQDQNLQQLICGLIHRQTSDVLVDSYANSFNFADEGGPHQDDVRHPPMSKHVFEGKYELDSLLAVLKLSYVYYNYTHDLSCFTMMNQQNNDTWIQAMHKIVSTIITQQASSEEELDQPAYTFQRLTTVASDTTILSGIGGPAQRCGLSKCVFRPSDDATILPFLVPANAMAVVELSHLLEILKIYPGDNHVLIASVQTLISDISQALNDVAVIQHATFGSMLAYEVDGFGSHYLMDDANIPSLLSLPYLGYINKNDSLYLNTRSFVLSKNNPFYFTGSVAVGVGGPHEGLGYIWPMSLIVQALTSENDTEIANILTTLKQSSAGTGFLHESFWRDDFTNYTRSWFAWCNSLFGELILTLARERPYLIF